MAKRFTDNEKWKDAWFMELPSKYKLFWLYLLDDCNHAGIWKVNFKLASFLIDENLERNEVKNILKSRIVILDDEHWFIEKFIRFQYKCDITSLNIHNKAHLSVLRLLNEHEYFKPLVSPLIGLKDKDTDTDKDKNKDQEKDTDTEKQKSEKKKHDKEKLKAIEYLKQYAKPEYEKEFKEPFKKLIHNRAEFIRSFDDKMIEEKHSYDTDRLIARLKRYARNWIKFQSKDKEKTSKFL